MKTPILAACVTILAFTLSGCGGGGAKPTAATPSGSREDGTAAAPGPPGAPVPPGPPGAPAVPGAPGPSAPGATPLNNTVSIDALVAEVEKASGTVEREGSVLRRISLAGKAAFGDEQAAKLQGVESLVSLDLSGTSVTDNALNAIGSLKNLESLNLSNTKISDAGLAKLGMMFKLKDLNLRDTKVTDTGANHLSAIPGLMNLDVTNTSITEAAAQNLRMAKPSLIVQGAKADPSQGGAAPVGPVVGAPAGGQQGPRKISSQGEAFVEFNRVLAERVKKRVAANRPATPVAAPGLIGGAGGAPAAAAPTGPAVEVTAEQLAKDFIDGNEAGDKKYAGKNLKVTGCKVGMVLSTYVYCTTGSTFKDGGVIKISLEFKTEEEAKVFAAGDTLTVEGTLDMSGIFGPIFRGNVKATKE